MPDTHITKNFFTDNGDELVIGGKLTVLEGADVEGLDPAGSYTLPTASAERLGGVKVGDGLTISDGVLSTVMTPAAYMADSEAGTIAALKADMNVLLAVLRAAGLMAAASENQGES